MRNFKIFLIFLSVIVFLGGTIWAIGKHPEWFDYAIICFVIIGCIIGLWILAVGIYEEFFD